MGSTPPIPSTLTPQDVETAFQGLKTALSGMTNDQLLAHLAQINAQIEAQQTQAIANLGTRRTLSDYLADADRISLSSIPTATPPADRSSPPSQPFPQQSSALDLLATSGRMGPKLAAQLVQATAKAQARKR